MDKKELINAIYLFIWMTPFVIWFVYHIIKDINERKKLRIRQIRDENWEIYHIGTLLGIFYIILFASILYPIFEKTITPLTQ